MQIISGIKTTEDFIAIVSAVKIPEATEKMSDLEKVRIADVAAQTVGFRDFLLARLKALPPTQKVIGLEVRADVSNDIETVYYRIIKHN